MKIKHFLFLSLFFLSSYTAVYAFDIDGDFSSRSVLMKNLFTEQNNIKQEQKDLLEEKKLYLNARCLIEQIKKGNLDNIGILLDAKLDPNTPYMGTYPIYVAAHENNFEALKLLLENGAKLDRGFNSELYEALKNKNEQMAQYLIENNAKVNYLDPVTNNTILYYAIKNNMQDIVQSLVKKGAKPDMKSLKLLKKNKKMLNLIQNTLN